MIQVNRELKEALEPYIAKPNSDEGREAIEDADGHIAELWEDGEVTTTKSHNGELYRARSLHQFQEPWLPRNEVLWEVPDEKDHQRMVILDSEAVYEILNDYAENNGLGPLRL